MSGLEVVHFPGGVAVIGGGISGITIAVELAEIGCKTFLIEKSPYLGGRVIRAHQYFPKLCSPYCGFEINLRRIKANPRIKVITLAEPESISGKEGDFRIRVKVAPRLVNDNCTACNKCVEVCPVERPNDFNYGLDRTRAIYLPHVMSFPMRYVIDRGVCLGIKCSKCVSACPFNAIDLNMTTEWLNLKVSSLIVATGWQPYDAARIDNLGFGKFPNVITNVIMERLASGSGPTGGDIVRPSDGEKINSIAFVQCAGSRDENHLPYCSGVCCLASLKQVIYVKEQNPDARIFIFYIDIRTLGVLEDFFTRVQSYNGLSLVKGKVARIEEDSATRDLIVEAEDTASGKKIREKVQMVVLATGMVPTTAEAKIPGGIIYDSYGFVAGAPPGVYAAGCARRPVDVAASVQDATGAALKVFQAIVRNRTNG